MSNAIAATTILSNLKPGSQTHKVMNHLILRGSISPLEASKVYGVERLTSRIYDIKRAADICKMNLSITKEMRQDVNGKRYMRYTLLNN